MQVLNFIIKNILTQAAVVVGLIALLGLVLQKKPIGTVVSGTMKTILGFLVLSAGSSVIQGSLAIFGDLFNKAFGLKGLVASIERSGNDRPWTWIRDRYHISRYLYC